MIKEVEYNDGESRLKGHVEVLPDGDGMYTVTCYVEDKIYGPPWQFVSSENVMAISAKQQNVVLKVLKKMAEGFKTKSVFDKLQDNGFSAL